MTLADEIIHGFRDFKTFTFSDVHMVLAAKHKGISDKTIQVTISRMVKKKKLYVITKGIFSLWIRDEIVGFAFSPFYYGGMAALMIRDLIDNQVKMEVMTTRTVKHSAIKVYRGSSTVFLHHLPKKYYFGFEDTKYGDLDVPVSDPEKTLIDLFYYKIKLPIQSYGRLLKMINKKKLKRYLRDYDKRIVSSVLDFVKEYKPLADSDKLENPY